jgi:hypothetical protein
MDIDRVYGEWIETLYTLGWYSSTPLNKPSSLQFRIVQLRPLYADEQHTPSEQSNPKFNS